MTARNTDWLETLVSWTSGLVVLALLGYLVRDAVSERQPATFTVSAGSPLAAGDAMHVPVSVRNTGDRAVQELVVTVTLERSGAEPREATFTLDWLAGRSLRRGVAVFPRAALSGGRVTAEVTGFAEP